jgi:DNA-binding transcriptional ArsR family regulator
VGWWQISADTLAGGRFVISPLAETTASLLILERGTGAHPGEHGWLGRHLAAYRAYANDHPVIPGIIRAAAARNWIPDLISAAPTGDGERSFSAELQQIIAMSPSRVAEDLDIIGLSPPQPGDLPAAAAELLEWVWANTVLPHWHKRRKILEADIVARTTQLSQGGWAAALAGMRPGMRWLGEGRLRINAYDNPPREISGSQLLFVPVTPQTEWVSWDEPGRYAVMYPCSGVLAAPDASPAPETLAALLGRSRAAILAQLGAPKTTTQLVALTGQPLGAVGRHLRILRDAGLLERRRAGRSVLYYRSAAGNFIVDIQNDTGSSRTPADNGPS